MTINVTPIPRLIDLAAPAFTLGTANAAGSALTAVASDATLLAFDTTDPEPVAAAAHTFTPGQLQPGQWLTMRSRGLMVLVARLFRVIAHYLQRSPMPGLFR